jgi:GNAT superfamily N-acetyltransferase
VLRGLERPKFERTLIARKGRAIVAVLHLQTKKPWAIDIKYFTPVPKALYLVGMAVQPEHQRSGAGRAILKEAAQVARSWREHTEIAAASGPRKKSSSSSIREQPVTAIRLDAWDSLAGAGPFYAKCGYREVARVAYRGNPLVYYELLL